MINLEEYDKIRDILKIDNEFDRFDYITDIALKMKDFPDIRIENNKLKNCETEVYFRIKEENGKIILELESDSLYIKGLYCIYSEIVYNLGEKEITSLQYYDFLKSKEILPYDRFSGLKNVEIKVKDFLTKRG